MEEVFAALGDIDTYATAPSQANQAVGSEFVGGNGGGVLNENGTMTITRCTISNNSAQYSTGSSGRSGTFSEGGGISNDSGGSLTITNSTISGNSCSVYR